LRISALPRRTSFFHKQVGTDADVAELVDALDLGSSAARRGGSSPLIRTSPPLQVGGLAFDPAAVMA